MHSLPVPSPLAMAPSFQLVILLMRIRVIRNFIFIGSIREWGVEGLGEGGGEHKFAKIYCRL